MKIRFFCLLALALAGCVQSAGQSAVEGFKAGFQTDILTGNTYAPNRVWMGPVDPAYPQAGTTYATSGYFHGLQVEYFAPDGTSYLWYPGNRRAVVGHWTAQGNELCFIYPTNTRNPVTGQTGGRPECRSRTSAAQSVVSLVAGDPFGLQAGRLPAHDLRTCRLPDNMLLQTQMRCLPKA